MLLSLHEALLDSLVHIVDFLKTPAGHRLLVLAPVKLCSTTKAMTYADEQLRPLVREPLCDPLVDVWRIYVLGSVNAHTSFWRHCNSLSDALTADEYRTLVAATSMSVRLESRLRHLSAPLQCPECVHTIAGRAATPHACGARQLRAPRMH